MNLLARFFTFVSGAMNGAEKSLLDLLSVFVPYCVPIIPAYLTYYHTIQQMDFPAWVAGTAAFVVEVLGLTSVATAIRFYRYNLKYKKEANRAPFKLAVSVYVFYIVVVLLVNVILEIVAETRGGWVILAIALFSMLSFPSGVLVSIRTQFSEMLEEKALARAPQSTGDNQLNATGKRTKHASAYREQITAMLNEEFQKSGKVLMPKEITAKLKLDHDRSKGFVSTLTTQWKKDNNIMGF